MIKIIKNEKSWMESNAIDQLIKTAQLKGVIKAVGLPDLHAGKTPVGASFVTKDIIYPHIIGNDIGCGMALFSTVVKKTKFKLDRVVKKLEKIDGLENIDISDTTDILDFEFKHKLGTIGSGNHFAEFQEVDTIYNEEHFEEIGMDKGKVYLLVHSGSRSYGEYILNKYIEKYSCQNGIKVGHDAFKEYMFEHNQAIAFGRLNRELIAKRISLVSDIGLDNKLLESVHNAISSEEIDNETVYIHRKGAAPSNIGYVVVAGSRATKSYIVRPKDFLNDYALSISHGSGRKWNRIGCKERLENVYSKKAIRQNDIVQNLIYKDKNAIYEEAPEAYKNIERVIADMLDEGMIELVASMKPILTYK